MCNLQFLFSQNCPVDESISFDFEHPDNWWIPPDTHSQTLKSQAVRVTAKREIILSAGAVSEQEERRWSGERREAENEENKEEAERT